MFNYIQGGYMNKTEFLEGLRSSLSNEMPVHEIEKNIIFYSDYITAESNNKNEDIVISELGEPRLIAKTLNETFKIAQGSKENIKGQVIDDVYTDSYEKSKTTSTANKILSDKNTWYRKLVFILILIVIVGIFLLLGKIVLSVIFSFGLPILVFIIVIRIIKNIIGGNKKE